ncbi:hypothetical protein LEMA_P083120.1 [Plenodomus lingam JN3]|uniref:Cyclin-dependent kinase n=1 Tax=Leptosphaeria maculans (strain JN3 / isolate v23.1.3 / race Av1-4-5-6-7-8) TaxID=985895 RepID=E5A628_LEPMJ|nr:hypothetical protein LEMA_P083120.1 [Plenodomus lingam JN3]CBX99073.1 hypothetical protein LEMA_P083120.1 [Plenodomus lingam JN3]
MSQVAAYYPAVGTMRKSRSPTPSRPFSYPEYGNSPIAPSEHANTVPEVDISTTPRQDIQHSQDSVLSAVSSTFSAPRLPSSSSNLSTSTTVAEAESTQPSSANVVPSQIKPSEVSMPDSPTQARAEGAQPNAPRIDRAAANAPRTGDTAAAAMPLESPIAQGFKRKADEPWKSAGSGSDVPTARLPAHKRNKSTDVHSSTRIGELSAQLKTRLSYAMVKVQYGWEKQSLDELEEVHSQRGSPNSAPERGDRLAFGSPYASDRRRRPSGVSETSDQIILSPASDPTRSYAITPPAHWRPGTKPAINAAASLISITNGQHPHGLAPAPTFQPSTRRRCSSVSHAPPRLLSSNQRKHYSDLGTGPQMPATPRAGILRMPSQQAEKDAVDTLLFMSSPNNSQRFPLAGQPASRSLRTEPPQRRVMFDTYQPQERHAMYQQQMPAPPHHHHHYGPYTANGAR